MEGKGGFSVLYLFIALAASLLLSAAIAYLEIKRDTEIHLLTTKVYSLIEDVEYLKQELAKVKNESSFLITQVEKLEEELKGDQNYSAPAGDDDYYEDEYDDPDTAEESRKRRSIKTPKRSLNDPYSPNNLKTDDEDVAIDKDESIIKQTYSNSSPPPVVATIFLETPYQRQRGGPLIGSQAKPAEENVCDYSKCMKNVAAHFDGNSSAARNGHHPHYDSSPGNHRMYHPNGLIREWTKASWVPDLYQDPTIIYDNGEVKLTDSPGLYFVYAQIFYADPHDSAGFRIYVNDDIVMQCTVTSHGPHRSSETKRNSCYTGGLVKLNVDDKISVKEVEGTRYTIFEHTKSFFGLFRVAAM